jgi:hypothetical protein
MFLNTGLSELVDELFSLTEINPADAKNRTAYSSVNFSSFSKNHFEDQGGP